MPDIRRIHYDRVAPSLTSAGIHHRPLRLISDREGLEASTALLPVKEPPSIRLRTRALPRATEPSEELRRARAGNAVTVISNNDLRQGVQFVVVESNRDVGRIRVRSVPDQLGQRLHRLGTRNLLEIVFLASTEYCWLGIAPSPRRATSRRCTVYRRADGSPRTITRGKSRRVAALIMRWLEVLPLSLAKRDQSTWKEHRPNRFIVARAVPQHPILADG